MTQVIRFEADDDLAVLRDYLRQVEERRVVLSFPWEARLLSRPLNIRLIVREARRSGVSVAIVSPDPEHRSVVRKIGLPIFPTVERAESAKDWALPEQEVVEPPTRHWWEDEISVWSPPRRIVFPRWIRHIWHGARLIVFLVTLVVMLVFAAFVIPQATVVIVPQGETFSYIVPVSAVYDPDMEETDVEQRLIPARRVGDYFEGYLEVETTGSAAFTAGRATGSVLFTNLLAQEVVVPQGTVVRTSSGVFPVRYSTTQAVTAPPLGQISAPIEAVDAGPAGNVGVNQINLVEGITGLALRVTNPEATYGGSTESLRAVSQADMDRARDLLIVQLLEEAHQELQIYLEPTEFLPFSSLTVQGSELSFNRFLSERADTLGLHMQILVTGLVVDRGNAQAIAYTELSQNLPPNYQLIETSYHIGEMAEESIGAGDLTFFVTVEGYAVASLEAAEIQEMALGKPLEEISDFLTEELPLAREPQVTVWPDWFPRMPFLPLKITVFVLEMG
jgi:hypothetical protein